MDDNVKSLLSLFRRLCELAFLTEASKREDAYKKIFYTNLIMKKLRIRLYEKLFMELQAPWIGTMTARKDGKHCKNMDLNAHEKIALMAFNLRLKREFDKADLLEYYCTKWKRFKGPLTSTTEASETNFDTCETEAVLRFLVALSNIDYQDSSPVLGYQNDLLSTLPKELICLLPEGPLLHTDSSKIRHQSLLEDQYILYSRDLFEKPQTIVTHVSNIMESSTVFPEIMAPCKGRRRFFTIQETGEVLHDKKTRLTVFGALSHGYTDDMQVKLGLPDLPQVTEKTFGVSSLSTAQASPDDEGFHELTDSTATYTSTQTNPESFESSLESGLDIWTEALKLPTQKFYTWEMEGRRDGLLDCPYISEAGPEVFDELYNLIYKQVSYLTKTPTHYTMTKVKILNRHSLDVLIGVPTTTFLYNMDVPGFNVNTDVRLSGCSPESLNATLSKLASIGTNYQNLVNFINHKEQTGGLVLHAFLGGLRNYLHCYRSVVLDFHDASMQSPLQLSFIFQNIGRQLRFLSDVCMCSSQSRPKGNTRQSSFPTGVKLLSYLYKLCLEHSSTDQYPVLLSLLKHSCAPYILFVQQWVFQGICRDVYEEFIIEVDDQFLAYRDKHFWSHGFVISEKDKLDCVPMFLSELANDIFVCGKSINLMKLCSPRHFLCDSGVPPPKMEVTFSMSKLKAIDQNCEDYVYAIEDISNTLKQKKEQQRIALEQAKEKVLMEERQRAEKALAEVTGLINDVKEAIDAKKKADLKMLKEQMEEAIKKRLLDKQLEDELDNQYMVDALNRAAADEELREKARQELIDYYKLLTEEMDRREERAQWKIKRHELNKRRLEFFAQEQVNLENLQEEAAKNPIKPVENVSSTRLTTVREASVTQSSEKTSVQSPSLSIVSLIASGIKTDAMIQSEVNKSTTISSAADSGVETDKTVAEGDVSEGQTLNSFASLDEADDTDTSIASTISAAPVSRKKWSSSEDVKPFDVKTEYRSKRRMWDSADDNIHLAESPFPRGHPSESSIQFSLYSVDKNVHDDIVTSPVVPPSIQTNTPNPSNSSIQNIMYPSGSAMSQDDSNRTLTGASHNRNTESDDKDNSAIQGSLKSDQSNDDPVIRDFVRSLSTGVNGLSSPTHRPSYSLDHPVESTDQTTPSGRLSEYGHPSDTQFNSAGDYLSRFGLSVPIPSGRRSPFGHPSDTQLDSAGTHSQERTALEQTPSKHRSPYGHPSDTRLDSTDSTPQNASTRRLWGHPSDSKVQNLLMNMSSVSEAKQPLKDFSPKHSSAIHPLTTRGTAPVDSIKDVLYPEDGLVSQDEQRHTSRGHEPAVKITKLMYPVEQKTETAPEPTKPLLFEDVWIASEAQPLQVNFDILDKHPTNNLLKSALSAIPMCEDDLDNDDDIDAAQLMSLPVLLRRSVTAPLVAQISLVNSAVVEYFMDDLKLMHHFEIFRKFLFMEDGEFALSLSEQLFEKLSTGVNPGEMCSPATMNAIVTRALQLSVYANKTGFEQRLSFALKSLPDVFNMNDIGTLDFLELRYQVPWPVNIIITENSIIKYNKVFSFMLRLKRVAWVLQEIWFHLKHIGFSRRAAGSPQLRQLQLFRHEMLHFLQNIDGYLSNQILNVTWVEFQQELVTNARDLDELHHRHTEYLNKAVFRSLLSKKATPVMKIISDMFSLVLKFRTQLLSCPWQQNGECSHVVHPRFDIMCATHKAFKEYSGFLFTVLSKLVRRGYQAHLQDFLLRLNFNDFYKT